jgi:hypothetical protein
VENIAELIQRLLEIQSGGRRGPELITQDKRSTDGLQKRSLAGKAQTNNKA